MLSMFFLQLGHKTVIRLQYGLERAYFKMYVPWRLAMAHGSGLAVTSMRRKGEEGGDHGGPKSAESRFGETRQSATKGVSTS